MVPMMMRWRETFFYILVSWAEAHEVATEPHFHTEQEREEIETNRIWDVIARELKLGKRSTYAVGGEAIRGSDGEPSRSPRRLLRLHRRHLRHRRRHVQGPLLSPLPFNVDLNLCIDLKFLCLWFLFFFFFFWQYKLSSWLAIIFCAQSLSNLRNFETDLKQVSMAMM